MSKELSGGFAFLDTPFVGILYADSAAGVELWYPERDGGDERVLLPIPSSADPVELTADGKLITQGEDGLAIWSLETGARVTSLNQPSTSWLSKGQSGTDPVSLVGLTETGLLKLDMDPDRWFEHLCKLNDRPYTDEERELLPEGADPTPPCETG